MCNLIRKIEGGFFPKRISSLCGSRVDNAADILERDSAPRCRQALITGNNQD